MNQDKPNLIQFSETLLALAKTNKDILVVTSDSRGSGKLVQYGKELPDQIVEVGIAEQNLVGVASGLASCGKIVFAVSPASFLTTRALEQIKNDVAYSDHPVKLIGISAGVSYGALGSTHHSLHDIAVFRAIHNLDIVIPADHFETSEVIKAAVSYARPIYIRFGKKPMPSLYARRTDFKIGKANMVQDGSDVAIIGTGETAAIAAHAAQVLAQQDLSAKVISMHTLKPLDKKAIVNAAKQCKAFVTLEEHSVCGGLGEACASVLMQENIRIPFKIFGLPDEETVSGSQSEIFTHYGLTADAIASQVTHMLNA